MIALSDGGVLEDLEDKVPSQTAPAGLTSAARSLNEQVDEFEKTLVLRALEAARGNQSEAARRLAVCRTTSLDKLKKHCLAGPSASSDEMSATMCARTAFDDTSVDSIPARYLRDLCLRGH